jgi:hypothetical protein
MFGDIMGDNLIKAFKPQIEKAIEPMFKEMRAALLTRLVGPPPEVFIEKMKSYYDFSLADIRLFWETACESVL